MRDLLNLQDLCKLFGLKPTAMRNLTKQPGFPPRIAISRRTHRWDSEEVAAYVRQLREKPAPPPVRQPRSS